MPNEMRGKSEISSPFSHGTHFYPQLWISRSYNYLLQVRGRRFGKLYSTPIDLLEMDGKHYLIARQTEWVGNVDAAGPVHFKTKDVNSINYRITGSLEV